VLFGLGWPVSQSYLQGPVQGALKVCQRTATDIPRPSRAVFLDSGRRSSLGAGTKLIKLPIQQKEVPQWGTCQLEPA